MKSTISLSLLLALCLQATLSFVVPFSKTVGQSSASRLHMEALLDRDDNDDDDDDDDGDSMKRMRNVDSSSSSSNRRSSNNNNNNSNELNEDEINTILEAAMTGGSALPLSASHQIAEWKAQLQNASPPPPLTTMRRVRIEKEIVLLQELAFSDTATDDLAELWNNERGPSVAKILSVADALLRKKGDHSAGQMAERLLIQLVEEEGLQFVAPLLLLAWKYAISGKAQESKDLYEMVLQQKPWHMGALVGMHKACQHLNDPQTVGMVEYECLPPLENVAQREQWVNRMVQRAQQTLDNANQGLQSYFDTACDGEDLDGCIVLDNEFGDEGAWQ